MLERLDADRSLLALPEAEANALAAGILRRVWRPPPPGSPYATLASVASRWARELPAEVADLIPPLLADPPPPVVLHQDFHHGNALAANREPWLMIDLTGRESARVRGWGIVQTVAWGDEAAAAAPLIAAIRL